MRFLFLAHRAVGTSNCTSVTSSVYPPFFRGPCRVTYSVTYFANLPVSLGFLEAEGAEREVEDGEEGAADARAEEARAPEDQTARVEDRRGVR